MSTFLKRFLGRIRPATAPEAPPPRAIVLANDQPKVEPGSMLAFIVKMSPASAEPYIDSVTAEIRRCLSECHFSDAELTREAMLEHLHALKNSLAATGSTQLLSEYEKLHADVSIDGDRAAIQRRYVSIGESAINLITNFKASSLCSYNNE